MQVRGSQDLRLPGVRSETPAHRKNSQFRPALDARFRSPLRLSPHFKNRSNLCLPWEEIRMADLIAPHGGLSEPVCLTVPAGEIDAFKAEAEKLPKVPVSA